LDLEECLKLMKADLDGRDVVSGNLLARTVFTKTNSPPLKDELFA
jgi:hypothetical protein